MCQSLYIYHGSNNNVLSFFLGGLFTYLFISYPVVSIAYAIEKLPSVEVFGGPGTLSACAMITRVLKSLDGVKTCGYSGLMLVSTVTI